MLRILFSLLILHASLVSFSVPALAKNTRKVASTAIAPTGLQDFAQTFPSQKVKVSELLKNLEGKVQPNYLEVMRENTKPVMNEVLDFEVMNGNKIVFKAQGNEAIFEIVNLNEGQFKINNKSVTLDFKSNPDQLWKDISGLLPQKTAASPVMMMLLPKAHAFWGWALVAGLFGVGLYMYNKSNCSDFEKLDARCRSAQSGNQSNEALGALLTDVRKANDGWLNIAWGCSTVKSAVKSCQSYLESKLYSNPPVVQDVPGLIRGAPVYNDPAGKR